MWWRAVAAFHQLDEQEQHRAQVDLPSRGGVLYTGSKRKHFPRSMHETLGESAQLTQVNWCSFFPLFSMLFIRRTSLSVLFTPALTNLLNLPNHMENGSLIWNRMKPGYWLNLFVLLSCPLKMYLFLLSLRFCYTYQIRAILSHANHGFRPLIKSTRHLNSNKTPLWCLIRDLPY